MRPGRPQQFDEDTVLENATLAFWENGYDACSLSQLLSRTGLSKSSLYNQFGDKHSLFTQCLLRYKQNTRQRFLAVQETSETSREFVLKVLQSVTDELDADHTPRGCLIMNTAAELGQDDLEIANAVSESLQSFRKIFVTALQSGQAAREFSAELDPDDMANYLISNIGGLRTMVKSGMDKASIHKTIEIILRALE